MQGSGIASAVAATAAWVRSLAWELPHAMGVAKERKKEIAVRVKGLGG